MTNLYEVKLGSISTYCTIGCDIEWESDKSSSCDKLTSQRAIYLVVYRVIWWTIQIMIIKTIHWHEVWWNKSAIHLST